MKVYKYLENEVRNEEMDIKTKFTVKMGRKSYLCTIRECVKVFGNLEVKKCSKVKDTNSMFNLVVA